MQKIPQMALIPGMEEVEAERARLAYRKRLRSTLRNTVYMLVVVSAVAVLLPTMIIPVLKLSCTIVEPTLEDGDIILLVKTGDIGTGDLIGFYYQNKLLLKRVIGGPGDIIDMDEEGNVEVNGEVLDEPYLVSKALGETDLTYPYQVPENRYFVMGDNRLTSIDSRSSVIGCIEKDQIVGKVFLRIWPIFHISIL
ncbi:MAG: signal peptidase I [Lachnospiraceae bacterium]|nr:signal peptidase I [Lachnospiraceae bacterium]